MPTILICIRENFVLVFFINCKYFYLNGRSDMKTICRFYNDAAAR